uniref:Fanconi-associated nuclease n=1 Tax=Romanomermis culicivorax TaxID=13658 RepID=A0A915ITA0_ROMCU
LLCRNALKEKNHVETDGSSFLYVRQKSDREESCILGTLLIEDLFKFKNIFECLECVPIATTPETTCWLLTETKLSLKAMKKIMANDWEKRITMAEKLKTLNDCCNSLVMSNRFLAAIRYIVDHVLPCLESIALLRSVDIEEFYQKTMLKLATLYYVTLFLFNFRFKGNHQRAALCCLKIAESPDWPVSYHPDGSNFLEMLAIFNLCRRENTSYDLQMLTDIDLIGDRYLGNNDDKEVLGKQKPCGVIIKRMARVEEEISRVQVAFEKCSWWSKHCLKLSNIRSFILHYEAQNAKDRHKVGTPYSDMADIGTQTGVDISIEDACSFLRLVTCEKEQREYLALLSIFGGLNANSREIVLNLMSMFHKQLSSDAVDNKVKKKKKRTKKKQNDKTTNESETASVITDNKAILKCLTARNSTFFAASRRYTNYEYYNKFDQLVRHFPGCNSTHAIIDLAVDSDDNMDEINQSIDKSVDDNKVPCRIIEADSTLEVENASKSNFHDKNFDACLGSNESSTLCTPVEKTYSKDFDANNQQSNECNEIMQIIKSSGISEIVADDNLPKVENPKAVEETPDAVCENEHKMTTENIKLNIINGECQEETSMMIFTEIPPIATATLTTKASDSLSLGKNDSKIEQRLDQEIVDFITLCSYVRQTFQIKWACDDCICSLRSRSKNYVLTAAKNHRKMFPESPACPTNVLLLKLLTSSRNENSCSATVWYFKVRNLTKLYDLDSKDCRKILLNICPSLQNVEDCLMEDECLYPHNST